MDPEHQLALLGSGGLSPGSELSWNGDSARFRGSLAAGVQPGCSYPRSALPKASEASSLPLPEFRLSEGCERPSQAGLGLVMENPHQRPWPQPTPGP